MESSREPLVAPAPPSIQVRRSSHLPGVELIWTRPTEAYPPHISMTAKVALVSQGAKQYRYRRKSWIAPPGSLVFANAGEAHEGRPVGESYEVFMLSLDAEAQSYPSFDDVIVNDPALARTFRSVCAAILGESTSPLHAETTFESLVARLNPRNRNVDSQQDRRAGAREPTAVLRALEVIRDLYAEQLSLDDLVTNSRLSKPRFLRAFKDQVGLPPHQYQLHLRVDHAKRLIAAGHPLVEVSARIGFFDQSHFHRHFRRIVGVSPGAYRKGCTTL